MASLLLFQSLDVPPHSGLFSPSALKADWEMSRGFSGTVLEVGICVWDKEEVPRHGRPRATIKPSSPEKNGAAQLVGIIHLWLQMPRWSPEPWGSKSLLPPPSIPPWPCAGLPVLRICPPTYPMPAF